MFGIIVGTHGIFAEEIVKSCEMICGAQTNVRTVTLVPGEGPDDVVKKYEAAIETLDCADGVIFLNDLFGGSPYNAACRLAANNEKYGIVTGVDLPHRDGQRAAHRRGIQHPRARGTGGGGGQERHTDLPCLDHGGRRGRRSLRMC